MKLLTFIGTWAICTVILTLDQVNCEENTVAEVGKKLLNDYKKYSLELFASNLQIWHRFSDFLLNEANPTAAEKTKILEYKNLLDQVIEKAKSKKDDDIIAAIYEFVDKHTGLINYLPQPDDFEQAAKIDDELFDSFEKSAMANHKFIDQLSEAWDELYDEVSCDEVEKHMGYENINDLMRMAKESKGDAYRIFKLAKELVKFFKNKDWLYYLGISQQGKTVNLITI